MNVLFGINRKNEVKNIYTPFFFILLFLKNEVWF